MHSARLRRQAFHRRLAIAREGLVIALGSLRTNKLRASLTTLGIVIGIVTVVLMITLIQGLNQAFMGEVALLGSHTLYVQKFPWVMEGDFFRYRNRPNLTLREAKVLAETVPGIEAVVPHVTTAKSVRHGERFARRVFVTGTTHDHPRIANLEPTEGRFLGEEDVRYRRYHCVLGSEVAERLFGGVSPLGARLHIGGYPFRVVGVLGERGSMFGERLDNIIYVPIGTLFRCFGRHRSLDIGVRVAEGGDPGSEAEVEVTAASGDLSVIRDEIRGAMRRIRGLRPGETDNFSVNEQTAITNMYAQITSGVYAGGIGIAGIALLVGGIGIMNIMMVSVVERTREIGVRKAIGAPRRTILGQFLTEAVILCLMGGVIGVAVAGGLAILIERITPLPMNMPAWVVVFALGFASFVGISFGFLPAYRAAKVDPIEALRYE
jgi:putative ABC transport system permease protein